MEAGESSADLGSDSDHGGLRLVAGPLEGTDLSPGVRLHPNPHREPGSTVKEWVNTVAIIALFLLVAIGALFTKAINDRELTNQTAQAQAALHYNAFFRTFITAQIYECEVLVQLAKKNALYPPPPNVCTISVP